MESHMKPGRIKANNRKLPGTAVILAAVLFVCLIMLTGCTRGKPLTGSAIRFDTTISLTIYGAKDDTILRECYDLMSDYEKIFSRTLPESELYKLNENYETMKDKDGFYELGNELAGVIEDALSFCELSQGRFDITIEPVSSLWDFRSDEPKLPDDALIKERLESVSYRDVTIDGNRIRFGKPGMGIDLGAVAKGYIADRIKEFLLEEGITSAVINLGGNVLLVGGKPDGEYFNIGIQSPFDADSQVEIVPAKDKSIVTSGSYERFFELDGVRYHHILDPATGYPVESDIESVSIISDISFAGDALSTVCFCLGSEKAQELFNDISGVRAVFVLKDGTVIHTEGAVDAY